MFNNARRMMNSKKNITTFHFNYSSSQSMHKHKKNSYVNCLHNGAMLIKKNNPLPTCNSCNSKKITSSVLLHITKNCCKKTLSNVKHYSPSRNTLPLLNSNTKTNTPNNNTACNLNLNDCALSTKISKQLRTITSNSSRSCKLMMHCYLRT